MEILVGLDVSLASDSVCALGANGKTVNEAKVPSDPGSLMEHLRELPGSVAAVGLEAGSLSQWLHKGLGEASFETVLMETRRVKSSLKAAPVKTDRRDAEGIAQLLRMGWFQPVHCKSVASREKRALLTTRSALVEGLTRLELSVRGIPRNFGLKLGRVSKGRWEERVREPAADDAMLSDAVAPILRLRREMRDELAMMTKKVRSLALPDATCRQLVTMPGVGPVTGAGLRRRGRRPCPVPKGGGHRRLGGIDAETEPVGGAGRLLSESRSGAPEGEPLARPGRGRARPRAQRRPLALRGGPRRVGARNGHGSWAHPRRQARARRGSGSSTILRGRPGW